ncbi:MAG: glycosyltransferase [Cetobacterium sp.]|uniref:glycosyltransferase n=1 Tax=Cetobacterium sp. TaxID=2071632 RepID=UPI003F34C37A
MNEIKFSVLMSIYKNDKKKYLIEAIESLLKQSLLPNEIVIVQDGEISKELNEVIMRYKENYKNIFKIVQLDRNYGLGLAMKKGLEYCNYEWVARMDADDISHPLRFEKQIEFIKNNLNIAIVGTNSEDFENDIKRTKSKRIMPEKNLDILKFAKRRCPFIHPTVIFNRNKIIEVGSYEDIKYFEDYNLFLKILKKYKGYNIQETLFYVRNNLETSTRRGGLQYLKIEYQALKIFYKNGLISFYYFITNLILRFGFRICGNDIRKNLYEKILRKGI